MKCENCGKEFFEDWRKDKRNAKKSPMRFCSSYCSRSFASRKQDKTKIAESMAVARLKYFDKAQFCKNCGKEFHTQDYSRKECFECRPQTIKIAKIRKEPKSILDLSSRTASKIFKRMDLPCSCCGFYKKEIVLDMHHIIPHSKGGADDMSNITYICPNCHRIAHTDINLLPNKLISVVEQMEKSGKNWKDYYYGKVE